MNESTRTRVTALALLLLAAALRFHDLGAWPWSGDETNTMWEEGVLFHGVSVPADSQTWRLPHAIPLSYLAFHASHSWFGSDERGTRIVVALLGSLSVVMVFVLLNRSMPRPTGLVAAVLVALMAQHVQHSQETRFYMVAAFFGFAALLAGARIPASRSTALTIGACVLTFLAVLSHTLLALLLPLMFVAVCAGSFAATRTVPRRVVTVFAVAAALLMIWAAVVLRPLLHGWNGGESWGYSPGHAILASIVMLGWPTALLAVVGLLLMAGSPGGANGYWLVCTCGWLGATVLLPLVVPYHPEYVFPLVIAPVVAAAYAISVIYELLRTRARLAANGWLLLACLMNLPALASYYVDGSRWNMRDAAAYIRAHWQPGDRLTGYAAGLFRDYTHGCCEPAIPLAPGSVSQLARLAADGGRLWVVLESTRSGLDPRVQRWLFDCATHRLSVGGRRFDDAEFREEVYLVSGPPGTGCTQPEPHAAKP